MKKIIGSILTIAGIVGVIYYGYLYIEQSESFNVFGADVAVSTGDYIPILLSVVILILGIIIGRQK